MDVAATLANISTVQNALRIAAMLQLTADMWPPQPNVQSGTCYDVIVVGAGSAGAVVAARLAQNGLNTLLVEAGGNPPIESVLPGLLGYIPRSKQDWNYTAPCNGACLKNCSIPLTRGKMLGGTSGANYMGYVRGNPNDYLKWSQIAQDPSWQWEHVLHYFKKSEQLQDWEVLHSTNGIFHGTNGPIGTSKQPRHINKKYMEAFGEIGHRIVLDVNGYDALGYTETMYTIADGVRQSTAQAFLHKDRVPRNLHVLKNTHVTRVIFDANKRAVGVETIGSEDQPLTFYASRRVILSAGALNTPQLLMLSGIGPASHLKSFGIPVLSDLPVGYNLQDHVCTFLAFKTEKLPKKQPPPPKLSLFPTRILLGFVGLDKSKPYTDYETENLFISADNIIQFCSFANNFEDEICQAVYDQAKGYEVMFTIIQVVHPNSRGRITLKSVNAKDPPLVDLAYYTDESDLDKMVSYIEDFIKISNSSYFKRVGAELIDPKLKCCLNLERWTREYWRCYAKCVSTTQFHYGGTAALGSVLDNRLRVRGVERLLVADSSAIPLLPSGNINAATIMIGEKAADMVLEDLIPSKTGYPVKNDAKSRNNSSSTVKSCEIHVMPSRLISFKLLHS